MYLLYHSTHWIRITKKYVICKCQTYLMLLSLSVQTQNSILCSNQNCLFLFRRISQKVLKMVSIHTNSNPIKWIELNLYNIFKSSKKDVWAKLEKLNGEKFPECVKFLLVKSAYNTFATLRQIDSDKLVKIETFLNTKKEYIADLDCCYHGHYKSLDVFEFLPGHKDLILSISSQIKQLDGSRQVRVRTTTISDDELQENLATNLIKYSEKIGLIMGNNMISKVNIYNFRRGSDKDNFLCRCGFICPLCAKKFTVTHNKYWATSNVTKHFKDHYTKLSNEQSKWS